MFSLLVVIHETLISAEDSKRLHGDPNYYASYHALIERSGKIIYLTPADSKAYAAADSMFVNIEGEKEHINGSVDDFAYHIALETPPDGYGLTKTHHIGYTKEQYQSLGWLIAATGVQSDRIVTHGEIVTPTTNEPRCFNYDYFYPLYEEAKVTGRKILNFGVLDYVS